LTTTVARYMVVCIVSCPATTSINADNIRHHLELLWEPVSTFGASVICRMLQTHRIVVFNADTELITKRNKAVKRLQILDKLQR
jgi:hypothetical protein